MNAPFNTMPQLRFPYEINTIIIKYLIRHSGPDGTDLNTVKLIVKLFPQLSPIISDFIATINIVKDEHTDLLTTKDSSLMLKLPTFPLSLNTHCTFLVPSSCDLCSGYETTNNSYMTHSSIYSATKSFISELKPFELIILEVRVKTNDVAAKTLNFGHDVLNLYHFPLKLIGCTRPFILKFYRSSLIHFKVVGLFQSKLKHYLFDHSLKSIDLEYDELEELLVIKCVKFKSRKYTIDGNNTSVIVPNKQVLTDANVDANDTHDVEEYSLFNSVIYKMDIDEDHSSSSLLDNVMHTNLLCVEIHGESIHHRYEENHCQLQISTAEDFHELLNEVTHDILEIHKNSELIIEDYASSKSLTIPMMQTEQYKLWHLVDRELSRLLNYTTMIQTIRILTIAEE